MNFQVTTSQNKEALELCGFADLGYCLRLLGYCKSISQYRTDEPYEPIFCSAWINADLDALQQSNMFINTY